MRSQYEAEFQLFLERLKYQYGGNQHCKKALDDLFGVTSVFDVTLDQYKAIARGIKLATERDSSAGSKLFSYFDEQLKKSILSCISLCEACKQGRLDIVKILLDKGRKINRELDEDGDSSLAVAARYGHTAVVNYLLERGALINTVNKFGQRPIDVVAVDHAEIRSALENRDPKLDYYLYVLDAIKVGGYNSSKKTLQEHLAKGHTIGLSTFDPNGQTLLHLAVKFKNYNS